jgi:hypothetical protein
MLAVGVGAIALLSGCGGNDFAQESADTIVKAASDDMKSLSSLRMQGEVTTNGEQVTIDLALNTDGDCQGSLGVMGGKAEIIQQGDQAWFKPDEAFWRATGGEQADMIISAVGDKWVVLPQGDESFTSFCDLDSLLSDLGDGPESDSTTEGDTEEVDGQETVIVNSKTDNGDPVKAWIATDDPHHIIKMEVDQGDEPGTISFSDFDEDLQIEAPAESDTIDLNNM